MQASLDIFEIEQEVPGGFKNGFNVAPRVLTCSRWFIFEFCSPLRPSDRPCAPPHAVKVHASFKST